MKTRNWLFTFFALALVLVAALTSCDKEHIKPNSNPDSDTEIGYRCCDDSSPTDLDGDGDLGDYDIDNFPRNTDSKNDKTEDE